MISKKITVYAVKSENASKFVTTHKQALALQATLAEFGLTTEITRETRKVNLDSSLSPATDA